MIQNVQSNLPKRHLNKTRKNNKNKEYQMKGFVK